MLPLPLYCPVHYRLTNRLIWMVLFITIVTFRPKLNLTHVSHNDFPKWSTRWKQWDKFAVIVDESLLLAQLEDSSVAG